MKTDKERIEKEAILRFGDNNALIRGYIVGATSERNKAIDDVLNALDKMADAKFDRSEIESLKQ